MDIRSLRYFLAVAEEGSFTRAAVRLHIAQPSLSQQISALERELGTLLLDRSARPLQPTAAGRRLLEDGHRLVAEFADTERSVRSIGLGRTGRLRVGVVYGGSYELLVGSVRAFRSRCPDVEVTVAMFDTRSQLPAVRRGDVDVLVHRVVDLHEPMAGLESHRLRREQLLAVLPEGHPAERAGRVPLGELAGERFLTWPRRFGPLIYDGWIQRCREAGFEPQIVQDIDDPQSLAILVATGAGIALTGDGLCVRFPGVRYLPVDPPIELTDILAVRRAGDRSALISLFVAELIACADGSST